MPNVDENEIKVTPDNSLLVWELTVLQALKTFPSLYNELKADYHFLGKAELSERGLRQVQRDSQRQAIESMSVKKEIIARPIYPAAYLSDGTEYDANKKDPVGYPITVFNPDEIDSLIAEKQALLHDKQKVVIGFKTTDDTVTITVNDHDIDEQIGGWRGDLLLALSEGNGEAKAINIRDYDQDFSEPNKQQIKNTVQQLNKKILNKTGIKRLLVGMNVVKLNKEEHFIELKK